MKHCFFVKKSIENIHRFQWQEILPQWFSTIIFTLIGVSTTAWLQTLRHCIRRHYAHNFEMSTYELHAFCYRVWYPENSLLNADIRIVHGRVHKKVNMFLTVIGNGIKELDKEYPGNTVEYTFLLYFII